MTPRPTTTGGSLCSTPSAALSIALLGGDRYEGVTISRDECDALQRLYGFDITSAAKEARDHAEAAHKVAMAEYDAAMAKRSRWDPVPPVPVLQPDGAARLMVAGASRNMFRHAEADGLRMVAAVARYLSPGDDPVRFLISIMAEAGLDVGEDPDWYGGSEEDEP